MGLLDKAAACVAAYAFQTPCPPSDDEERICQMVCCCNAFPIAKTYKLKQLCVDQLIAANELKKDGILGGVPYDMQTKEVAAGYPSATIAAQLKKYLEGAYYSNRIRIPDVTVLEDLNGPISISNLKKFYEIKFPNDKLREGQIEDYRELAGDPDKVKVLKVEDCNCTDRDDHDQVPVPEAIKQAAIDRANGNIVQYISENEEELFKAMKDADMPVEATQLGMAYLNASSPSAFFFYTVLAAVMPALAKTGTGLGQFPSPKPLPPLSPVQVP